MSKFEVKVEQEMNRDGLEFMVMVTHNGFHWSTCGNLTLDQLKTVRDEINLFFKEKGK